MEQKSIVIYGAGDCGRNVYLRRQLAMALGCVAIQGGEPDPERLIAGVLYFAEKEMEGADCIQLSFLEACAVACAIYGQGWALLEVSTHVDREGRVVW